MPSLTPAGKKQSPINKEVCSDQAPAGGLVQQGFIRREYTADKCLTQITSIDDTCEIAPPPFRTLIFDMHMKPSNPIRYSSIPITHINIQYGNHEQILDGDEPTVLEEFATIVDRGSRHIDLSHFFADNHAAHCAKPATSAPSSSKLSHPGCVSDFLACATNSRPRERELP